MNLIFSADANWGIGKDNQLLFHVPPDMRFFVEKTRGGAVIMGRKTLESLPGGRPLKDRTNIVLTGSPAVLAATLRQKGLVPPGAGPTNPFYICASLAELALCLQSLALPPERVWVIGGAEIYRLLAPYSRQAYVTRFLAAADADRQGINLDREAGWQLAARGENQSWEGLVFRFDRYVNSETLDLPV